MFGCHISRSNITKIQSLNAQAVQLFLTTPKRLTRKPLSDDEIDKYIVPMQITKVMMYVCSRLYIYLLLLN